MDYELVSALIEKFATQMKRDFGIVINSELFTNVLVDEQLLSNLGFYKKIEGKGIQQIPIDSLEYYNLFLKGIVSNDVSYSPFTFNRIKRDKKLVNLLNQSSSALSLEAELEECKIIKKDNEDPLVIKSRPIIIVPGVTDSYLKEWSENHPSYQIETGHFGWGAKKLSEKKYLAYLSGEKD